MKDWLEKVGGDVCAPGNYTCKSLHGGRTIDLFIVDSRISHGVQGVWTQLDLPSSPHYMVVLRLAADASTTEVVKIISPKSFEAKPLVGCQRKIFEPDVVSDFRGMQPGEELDLAFKMITEQAEQHLCMAFEKVLPDGAPDPEYIGRGVELKRRRRPAVAMNAKEECMGDVRALGLMAVHLRLCEMAALMLRFKLAPEKCSPTFFAQWNNIAEKVRSPSGYMKTAIAGTKLEWFLKAAGMAIISEFRWRPMLLECASQAKAEVKNCKSAAAKASKEKWYRWVDDQLRCGAGALHKLAKKTEAPIEEAVYVHQAKPDDVVQRELRCAEVTRQLKKAKDKRDKEAKALQLLHATPLKLNLACDVNLGACFRPCHACPNLQREM